MIFSKPILGTETNNPKMSWWSYWIEHCYMTGWQSIRSSFHSWCDWMTSNYEGYALLPDEDDEQECREWFWNSLGEDETYPKDFLEALIQMAEDVKTGKVETVPVTQDMFDRIEQLLDTPESGTQDPNVLI